MKVTISDEQYALLLENAKGQSIDGIWVHFEYAEPPFGPPSMLERFGLTACREAFFDLLQRLVFDGELALGKDGALLKGTTETQLAQLRAAFPTSLVDVATDGGISTWLITDECPVQAVWIYTDAEGQDEYEWT